MALDYPGSRALKKRISAAINNRDFTWPNGIEGDQDIKVLTLVVVERLFPEWEDDLDEVWSSGWADHGP